MEYLDAKNVKAIKDVEDTVQKIRKIQRQIAHPDRIGMIEALGDAQSIALVEVRAAELINGQTTIIPAEKFSDNELYKKLFQYENALIAHGIGIIGKEAFEKYLNKQLNESQ